MCDDLRSVCDLLPAVVLPREGDGEVAIVCEVSANTCLTTLSDGNATAPSSGETDVLPAISSDPIKDSSKAD